MVTGGIKDSTYRSLAQQRLKLIDGLHHIGGEGGMRLQEIGPTIRQGTVEIGIHRNDIRTDGIFNVVLLPSELRLGINAPFLMEKAERLFHAVFRYLLRVFCAHDSLLLNASCLKFINCTFASVV